jgi:hypothetical protein
MAALCGAYAAATNSSGQEGYMATKTWTDPLAWGLVVFTALTVMVLLAVQIAP